MSASMAATALAVSPFMTCSPPQLAGRLAAPRSPPPAPAVALRRRALVVRAQASNDDNEATEMDPTTETKTKAAANFSPSLNPTPSSSPPYPKPMALSEAMAFSGPAPERVNGRAAMVGFVAALAVEASRGGGLLSQAGSGAGLAWLAATAAVLSVASLVPLLRRGETAERRGGGDGVVMSADAELWNGRFAMLGLVALAFTEYLTGAPLVNV